MNTKKGKKKHQKHRNKKAFQMRDKIANEKLIKSTPIHNLCEKCVEIIEWKLKYGKYKKLTKPQKCLKCNLKRVVTNYRTICNPCATKHKLCAKCSQEKEIKIKSKNYYFLEILLKLKLNF